MLNTYTSIWQIIHNNSFVPSLLMSTDIKENFLIPVCSKIFLGKDTSCINMPVITAQEWEELCEFASFHGLMSVLFNYLQVCEFDDEESKWTILSWFGTALQDEQTSVGMSSTAEKLAKVMQKGQIDVMFLKGMCLAQYYPAPTMRLSSDIDFYLFDRPEEGLKVLEGEGIACDDDWDYHAHAEMDGIRLELHQNFIDIERVKTNEMVEQALKELAKEEGKTCRCRWIGKEFTNAYQMTPTMNAIFLMRHMAIHFVSETITLRMLYDWALFLINEGKDVDWKKTIALYERTGMTVFVCRIQHILISKLGMPVADCLPVEPLGGEKTDRLWNYILSQNESNMDYQSPLKVGIMRRYQLMKDKWKYDMVYPNDSFWKTFIYLALRGVRTISRRR